MFTFNLHFTIDLPSCANAKQICYFTRLLPCTIIHAFKHEISGLVICDIMCQGFGGCAEKPISNRATLS